MRFKILATAVMTLLLVGCGNAEAVKDIKTANINETLQSTAVTSEAVTTATTAVSKTTRTETKAKVQSSASPITAKTTEKTEQTSVTEEEREIYRTQHSSALNAVKKEKAVTTEQLKAEPDNTNKTVATEAVQPVTEAEEQPDTFYGVLIDWDCSDFEDPPAHDLPCMLMDECRASGYGVDIQQSDGSWVFYMFDERGQELAWDYLRQTSRMDRLYVSVTGKWENNVIKVISLNEV